MISDSFLRALADMPPMSRAQQREQALDFAWGQLQASTNHRSKLSKEEFFAEFGPIWDAAHPK